MNSVTPSPDSNPAQRASSTFSKGFLWTPPEPEALSAVIPHYEILELLGRGGMGAVYKARQKSLRRTVAIKLLPHGAGGDDPGFADRFKNEAFAIARLNHPGIVTVHDTGETDDGLLYYVMEFVDGRDLSQEIASRGALPEEEVEDIFLQVCEALNYTHANGIVHRDIKPANLLVDVRGRVKVADFGLAKFEDLTASGFMTRTGTTVGTLDFMAPELRKAGALPDARADLFSFGVTIYQMLTGELPRGMFKMPSECVPGLSDRWDGIICKALEPKPEDRYQSVEEMRADLNEATPTVSDEPLNREVSPRKRRIGLFLATGGVLAPLTVSVILLLSKGHDKPGELPVDAELRWQRVDLSAIKSLKREGERYQSPEYVLLENLLSNDARDMAVRVTAAPAPGNFPLAIMLRTAPGGKRYQAVIRTETVHRDGISYWQASAAKPFDLQNSTGDRAIVDGQTPHVLEFRAIAGTLTLLQDGIVVARTSDERLKQGRMALQMGGGGVFSSIEYIVLDGLSSEAQEALLNGR